MSIFRAIHELSRAIIMKGKQLALIISHAERRFLKGSYKTLANAAASLHHGKKGFPQYS